MNIQQEITVECFEERIANCMERIESLRKSGNQNYLSYESVMLDMIAEINNDMRNNK